jgi:hypothetical protein
MAAGGREDDQIGVGSERNCSLPVMSAVVGIPRVHYYKNGALQFTSSQAPVYPLYVTTSMIDGSSTISQAMISSAPPPGGAVTWVNQVNTTVNGTTITKTGGQTWAEDAGAASQQSIASGNATFQFTVDETSRFRFVGFGHTSTGRAPRTSTSRSGCRVVTQTSTNTPATSRTSSSTSATS